jgi:2-amino-4-hydroxy-6-hydroxymethyldihydropteridine diphosphokinase
MMKEVYLGLGSDLGNREANLLNAIGALETEVGRIIAISPVYETDPVGFKGNADFLNMVISAETILSPDETLKKILTIESEMGRVRVENRYGSRIIDIDLLLYADEIINDFSLIVPHPRMHERKFVLVPMNDIAPGLNHPVLGKTMSKLLADCKDKGRVRLFNSRPVDKS